MKSHYVSGSSQRQRLGLSATCWWVYVICSDHLKHLCRMYSVVVAKSHLPPVVAIANPRSLRTTCFEPTSAHVASIKLNLSIIFCRILCTFIKDCKKLKRLHIYHKYSLKMSEKSEVAVLDVLYKNQACHQDMLDIHINNNTWGNRMCPIRRWSSYLWATALCTTTRHGLGDQRRSSWPPRTNLWRLAHTHVLR